MAEFLDEDFLDLSLDDDDVRRKKKDIIRRKEKKSGEVDGNPIARIGGGRRGHGPGPIRRTPPVDGSSRAVPYPRIYVAAVRAGHNAGEANSGTRLFVSNVHPKVTTDDIRLLFSEVCELKATSVLLGMRPGNKVTFARYSDAFYRYNGMKLHDQPIKIDIGVEI